MEPRLLHQKDTGLKVLWHKQADGTFLIEHRQDVEAHLDRNKAQQNDGTGGWMEGREMRRAASIPDIIVVKWLEEDGLNVFDPEHEPRLRRKLNDPDYKWLRTAEWRF